MAPNAQFGIGFTNPADPNADYGRCDGDRTHLANGTVGYMTPRVNGAVGVLASNWRVAGILNIRSGTPLNILSGRDNAFNGQANQRVDQISNDVYGEKTLTNFLNRAAFAQPAPGAFGNYQQPRRPGILEDRSRHLAARLDRIHAEPGAARGGLQPDQQLQLERSEPELRGRDVRPHHDAGGHAAHPAVRREVRILGVRGAVTAAPRSPARTSAPAFRSPLRPYRHSLSNRWRRRR